MDFILTSILMFGMGVLVGQQRNTSITDLAGADGSLLGKITDFFYFKFLLKDAEKFKQQQAQEDSAYDEYKEYEKQAQQDSYDAQAEAKQRTEQARRASDSAREKQEDIHKQWHKFQKEKEKFEQEKAQDDFVDTRNNYEILGVAETASLDEIKKAFKKISMKFHPDRNRNKPPKLIREAEKEFIKAQHAYEALTGKKAKR